jgi:hypothetical protein
MIMNCMATESIGWKTPIQMLTGQVPDISPLLKYKFNEPVYYKRLKPGFPSESTEALGYWVGMAPNVGHAMTQDPDGRHPEDHCTILHTYCYDRRNKEPTYRSRHGKATVFVSSARDEATEKRELFQRLTPTWTDLHHHAR